MLSAVAEEIGKLPTPLLLQASIRILMRRAWFPGLNMIERSHAGWLISGQRRRKNALSS